jgi:hypothetical protein
MIKVWGQPLKNLEGICNYETPLMEMHERNEKIDAILVENGATGFFVEL